MSLEVGFHNNGNDTICHTSENSHRNRTTHLLQGIITLYHVAVVDRKCYSFYSPALSGIRVLYACIAQIYSHSVHLCVISLAKLTAPMLATYFGFNSSLLNPH